MALDPRLNILPEHQGPALNTWMTIMESVMGKAEAELSTLTPFKQNVFVNDDFIPLTIKNKDELDNKLSNQLSHTKRRRHDNSSTEDDNSKTHFSRPEVSPSKHACRIAPWRLPRGKIYPENAVGLHQEIIDFYKYISPMKEEEEMRSDVVSRVKSLITRLWPAALVDVFGSYKTGLYLPTSDIDMVVFGKWEKLPLRTLETALVEEGLAEKETMKVLDKASVPIIKLTDKKSQVKVDISFNMKTAVKGAELVKRYCKDYPTIPQLFVVLKQYLHLRGLNEVFSGGISSYCLMLLTISFLQRHSRPDARLSNANLGVLLMEFFELYGRHFNYGNTGIKINNGGRYINKTEVIKEMKYGELPSPLYVADPIEEGNDIGKGSYGVMRVRDAFKYAYCTLDTSLRNPHYHESYPDSTYLSRILQVPDEVIDYRQWIKETYSSNNNNNNNGIDEDDDLLILVDEA